MCKCNLDCGSKIAIMDCIEIEIVKQRKIRKTRKNRIEGREVRVVLTIKYHISGGE